MTNPEATKRSRRIKPIAFVYGIVFGCILIGCQTESEHLSKVEVEVAFDQELANELKNMAKLDQIAAYIPQGEHKKLSPEEWADFKLATFEKNRQRLEQLFKQIGFIGYDRAGKEGSDNFWLMVQHCDHAPEFQQRVLEEMKKEVANGNATANKYAMLVDRVQVNLGNQQVYGTQVSYDLDSCQAYSKNLANPEQVNRLREQVGLEPLEVYLNDMSKAHFTMNKERYIQLGIKGPTLYPVE